MNIRIMQSGDYEAVYALWLSCKGMGLNSVDDSRDGIDRFLLRNPDTCFVTEENAEIIGAIYCPLLQTIQLFAMPPMAALQTERSSVTVGLRGLYERLRRRLCHRPAKRGISKLQWQF